MTSSGARNSAPSRCACDKRAPRELAAAHAGGKSEIVFNARAGARLAARRMPVKQKRSQTL